MVANRTLEAAKNGDIAILQTVKTSSDDADQHGATCLHYAARGGNVKTIEFLVKKKGFDAAIKSKVGATAAHDAAATGNLPALRWILENSECKVDDQDGTGATVLHLATRYGHTSVVTWLLGDTNCDVMKKTATGAMPLHFAVVGGKLEIVKLLLREAPRSVNLQMNNGVTAVYLASQSGHLEILQYLVTTASGSTKINSYDAMSVTQAAAQNGHLDCVKWLVKEQKCNANERDFDGASALHFAATRGHHEVVDWLMKEGGARVTLDNLGGSPLHNAAEMGHKKVIEVLLRNGCDVTITDNKGLTAAELADNCHQPECAAVIRGEVQPEATPSSILPPLAVASPSQVVPERSTQPSGFQGFRNSYQRPPSVASTCSDFGYYPRRQSVTRNIVVQAEVYNRKDEDCLSQLSKETGESECVFLPSPQASSITINRPPSPRLQHSTPLSPPTSPPYRNRNRESLGSELSSTASTLSSLSASASREFEESDDGQEVKNSAPSPQRSQFASVRAQFENRNIESQSSGNRNNVSRSYENRSYESRRFDTTKSSGSCEESGESVPSSSPRYSLFSNRNAVEVKGKNMANPIQTSQNGGMKKTVIQIRGSTVHIDDGTGSRDIKTHSQQNGGVPSHNRSSQQPKLIMTMTPSETSSDARSTAQSSYTSTNLTHSSEPSVNSRLSANGLPNGNISPRNSTAVSKTSSSENITSKTVSSISSQSAYNVSSASVSNSNTHNGGSSMTNSVSSARTSPGAMSGRPPGFSALGDLMKTALPRKVTPDSPPPARREESASSSASASPAEERSRSPTNVNVKPSSIVNSGQNGFARPKSYGGATDLIAELQSGPGKSGLKQSRGFNKGTKMVFSFGGGNMGTPAPQATPAKDSTDSGLVGEFDPKNFVDQVPETDAGGQSIPQWKRQMLAKGIAEKAKTEAIERSKVEAEEERFRNVPAWKRALIEKKDAESKAVQDRIQASQPVRKTATPQIGENGKPLTWQEELRRKKELVE